MGANGRSILVMSLGEEVRIEVEEQNLKNFEQRMLMYPHKDTKIARTREGWH